MVLTGSNHKGKSKNTRRNNKGTSSKSKKNTRKNKGTLSDTNTNKARRNAISRSGVVLDEPGITWETLIQSPYAQQFTHKNQEYIFMHSEGISNKTVSRPSKTYKIPELYVKYKEQLEQFCNDTFPTELIEYYMGERDFQLYFILRNDKKTNTVVIEAFMTIHMYQGHVGGSEYENMELGTFCVAPKRGGLGSECIKRLQELVEKSGLDYLFLTPATGAAPFYKRLGFRMYEPEIENENGNENGNEKHTYMIWCTPGATDPLCSMKNNGNTSTIMPTT